LIVENIRRVSNKLLLLLNYSEEPRREESFPGRDGEEGPPGGLTDADFDSNWDESIETFDAMELPEELLRGIYSYGFEKPSAIQQRAIRPTMLGRDLIAQAQSGTVRVWDSRKRGRAERRPGEKRGRMNHKQHHLSSLNKSHPLCV
jgi:hypothetical protein